MFTLILLICGVLVSLLITHVLYLRDKNRIKRYQINKRLKQYVSK